MKENYELMLHGLLREKENLLKKNPELQEYQDEIDSQLSTVGDDPLLRCEKLVEMLMHKMQYELLPAKNHAFKLRNKLNYMTKAEKYVLLLGKKR